MNLENQVNLTGRLAKENQLRNYTLNGENRNVLNNTLAIKSRNKDKPSKLINITIWGKTADFIFDNTQKGDKISVYGELTQNVWEDEKGQMHYELFVNVEEAKIIYSEKYQNNFANQNQAQQKSNPTNQQQEDYGEIQF